jgi:hypothetical protein
VIDLQHEIKRELSLIDPPDLWDRIQADAANAGDAAVLDLSTARQRRRPSLWLVVAAVTVLVVLVGALALLEDDPTVDTTPIDEVPTPISIPGWSGSVRDPGDEVQGMLEMTYDDPIDTSEPWADVTSLYSSSETNSGHWNFGLAATAPFDREAGLVVGYGLVFDTDSDGTADYVVGIDNDGPQGDPRAWVTDLKTGETEMRDEPPYGFPVEFGHPSEESGRHPILTFLPGTAPRGLDAATVNFYAWASATRDGVVVAHDFAPDTGWISADGS